MKTLSSFIAMLLITTSSIFAQVAINSNGIVPNPSAGLDVNFTDKGLLIPRVSLENTTSASPVTSPATSLLVYNTAIAGDVTPGYYFWNGTAWSRLSVFEGGSGTTNYIPKWSSAGTLGSSLIYDNGGNIGIGTTTPGAKLDVAGGIWQTSTGKSVFIGEGAGTSDDLSDNLNVYIGYMAGHFNTTGENNTANGYQALYLNTGDGNNATGYLSLGSNTSGSYNTANGYCALNLNSTGSFNVANGLHSLFYNTTGSFNTANGYRSLYSNETGSNIAAYGHQADVSSGDLTNATAIGAYALAGSSNSLVLGSIAGVNGATESVNVGIGTTTPSARLDVVGKVKITDGTHGLNKVLTSDANGLASWQTPPFGWSLLGNAGTTAGTNFIGTSDSMAFDIRTNNLLRTRITTKGAIETYNTGQSVFLGEGAGASDDLSDNQNVFLGYQAGKANTSGLSNVAIGTGSLYHNTDRNNLVAIGDSALYNNGLGASFDLQAKGNTAVGSKALHFNTTGFENSAFGFEALRSNNFGSENTANGFQALKSNTYGVYNTANGYRSLYSNEDGQFNTANGGQALYKNTSGSENIAIGLNALYSNVTGSYNTIVGTRADVLSSNLTNATAIGSGAAVNASNSLVLGSIAGVNYATASVNVGIGTTTPSARLDVVGQVKITDGTHGLNKVLTSDANGLASWQNSDLDELAASPVPASPGTPVIVSTGSDPFSVAVSGSYAYVVNANSNNMYIYNVSNPDSPGTPVIVSAGNCPVSVAVSGSYAYVVNANSNNMYIYNVSNPDSPGTPVIVSAGNCPVSVAVSGSYAYVVNYYSNNMYIYNVSNPDIPGTPVIVSTGAGPFSVAVSGSYAYVVNYGSDNMYIYNVSNPDIPGTPVIVSTGAGPYSVAVSGSYAYVVNAFSNNMYIYNVSNPESPGTPVIVSTGAGPFSVAVSGSYAYVVNYDSDNMYIYNVTDPDIPGTPVIVSTGSYPISVSVSGSYAYVVNYSSDNMYIYNVSPQLQNLMVQDGNVVLVPATWSTSNNDIFNANPGNVGIGTTSPGAKLDVSGRIWQTSTGHSVFIGEDAGAADDTTNNQNVFVGYQAGKSNTTGFYNTSNGYQALYSNTTGFQNMANGYRALYSNTTGNNNTAIGYYADVSANNLTNAAAIGYRAYVSASNSLVLGSIAGKNGATVSVNVGIGTTSPPEKLTITNGVDADVKTSIVAGGEGQSCILYLGTPYQGLLTNPYKTAIIAKGMTSWSRAKLLFCLNDDESNGKADNQADTTDAKMTILSAGNVGIGTTTPSERLDVVGNARFRSVGSGSYVSALNLSSNGVLTTSTSDIRLKTNIETINDGLQRVMKLRGVTFNWKEYPDNSKMLGFIAQEVEQAVPELVFTNQVDGYKGVNYGEMSAVLVEAVKQQQKMIEELSNQNQELKTENSELGDNVKIMKAQIELINGYLGISMQK